MTDTSTMPAPPAPRIQAILGHVAVPFFVFAAVLASLLTLSLFLLLPLLTQVEVAGVQRDARSLLSYRAQLINQVEGLEQERGEAVIPINDPGYEALKSWRRGAGRYVAVREAVLRTALSLSSTEDAIHVLIPTSKISSLQMSFQSDGKQTVTAPVEVDKRPKATEVVKEKGKSAQIVVSRELEPQIQEDAGNRVIVDEIRTDPIEKKEVEKYYRLKTKKTKKESLLEEDDKLVTKTEDASKGIHESVEDEKLLTETEETYESNQDLFKKSHDKEVDKAVEEDIKKEEPVIQDRNLGGVEGKILRSGSPLPAARRLGHEFCAENSCHSAPVRLDRQ